MVAKTNETQLSFSISFLFPIKKNLFMSKEKSVVTCKRHKTKHKARKYQF